MTLRPSCKSMRFTTFTIFAVTTFLLYHDPCVIAGWPVNISKKDKEKLGGIVEGKLELPTELELFIKYKNKRGKRFAKKWSKNGKFDKKLPKRNIITIHASNSTALRKLMKNRHIEYVEPVHKARALPLYRSKHGSEENARRLVESPGYGIDMVQASDLWGIPPAAKLTVCLIDSGYALGHPDLPTLDNNVTGTSTSTGDWFVDTYGHGSHCAGVIGAIGNNNQGVAGVLRDPTRFNFHIGKSLNSVGDGSESDLLDAFESCIDAGAQVISMSLGIDSYSETFRSAFADAYDGGALMIAAAGNDGDSAYSYPASYPHVMSVAAVDKNMKVAAFSQYNDQVEIAGPGVDIISTVTTNNGRDFGYDSWSGTSMATPYVAGVAAVVWSYFPECTNNQIRNVLIRTARDKGNKGCTQDVGFGIVQAKSAYDLLKRDGCNAGNLSPHPLSDGGIGGCSQDPQYTPLPPAALKCTDRVFLLELTTDKWGDEISWNLTNFNGEVVASGCGYRSSKKYIERACLPPGRYTFSIIDSERDGMCCDFGFGHYKVYFDGDLVGTAGNFTYIETVSFGQEPNVPPTVAPNPTPLPSPGSNVECKDDDNWVYTDANGLLKPCKYLEHNRSALCKKMGIDGFGAETSGYNSCPVTCDSCPIGILDRSFSPTRIPTMTPSSSNLAMAPTPLQPPPPTFSPTSLPTLAHSMATTVGPTYHPSGRSPATPTRFPTFLPTRKPSALPTESPMVAPTILPASATSMQPSFSLTRHPTEHLTATPAGSPTSSQSLGQTPFPPTIAPTTSPTAYPTWSPTTPQPTRNPSHSPTSPPSTKPTFRLTYSPTVTEGGAASEKVAPTLAPTAAGLCTDDICGFCDTACTMDRSTPYTGKIINGKSFLCCKGKAACKRHPVDGSSYDYICCQGAQGCMQSVIELPTVGVCCFDKQTCKESRFMRDGGSPADKNIALRCEGGQACASTDFEGAGPMDICCTGGNQTCKQLGNGIERIGPEDGSRVECSNGSQVCEEAHFAEAGGSVEVCCDRSFESTCEGLCVEGCSCSSTDPNLVTSFTCNSSMGDKGTGHRDAFTCSSTGH